MWGGSKWIYRIVRLQIGRSAELARGHPCHAPHCSQRSGHDPSVATWRPHRQRNAPSRRPRLASSLRRATTSAPTHAATSAHRPYQPNAWPPHASRGPATRTRARRPGLRVRRSPFPRTRTRHGPRIKPQHATGQDLPAHPKSEPKDVARVPRHATRLPLALGPRAAGGAARAGGHGHDVPAGPAGHDDEPRLRLVRVRGSRAAPANRPHVVRSRADGAR